MVCVWGVLGCEIVSFFRGRVENGEGSGVEAKEF